MKIPSLNLKLDENAKKVGLFLIIVGCFIFNTFSFYLLSKEKLNLESQVEAMESALSIAQKNLSEKNNENIKLSVNLKSEQETNTAFQNQIEGIKSTVGVLEKLSKTDSELLKKYSKVYFLNENYIPQKLVDIKLEYLWDKTKPSQIHADVWPHLDKMFSDARANNIDLQILSAYRSFDTQATLKSSYKVTYGYGANKFSADQGYSEHQLGTTLDFTTSKNGSVLTGFEKTEAYNWLLQNAYKYGFVMSYPKENTFYIFEPWHWRYIGVYLATKLHEERQYFYALDQRVIDGYLIGIFD